MYVSTLSSVIAVLSFSLAVHGQYEGHLRLVDNLGNTGGNSGRLEVYFNGEWGTVCDDLFERTDAVVACNQLGYTTTTTTSSTFTATSLGFNSGDFSAPIWLDDISCDGSETRLADCSHSGIGDENCVHNEDVGLSCSATFIDGHLRLVDNFGNIDVSFGRLEVYYTGQSGSVCNNFFDSSDATVACHQLGFKNYQTFGTVDSLGFILGPRTWLNNLNCAGTENRLIDCPNSGFSHGLCSLSQTIALECSNSDVIDSDSGVEGDARLVGVSGLTRGMAGRVEVHTNSRWVTISTTSVGEEEADVICKQLGFPASVYYGTVGELGFSQGSSSTALNSFSCSSFSSYTRWTSCSYFASLFFEHSQDFAVSCAGTYSSTNARQSPTEEDLRLNTDGSTRTYSGRLEIYYNLQWGTICDDLFDKAEADVACRQLGFVESLYDGNNIGFGGGSGPIWLDNLGCSSTHRGRLADCSHPAFGTHNCDHSEDVAVVCVGEGSLRLTSDNFGSTSASLSSGRLEVYAGGRWGTVCDDGFGQAEADVACRQLGYSRASGYDDVVDQRDYDTSLPILLDEVSCSSSPNILLQCSHRGIGNHDCSHSEDITITCSSVSSATAVGIGVGVTAAVIVVFILACVFCCYCYTKGSKKNTTLRAPRMVNTVGASTTTTVIATNSTAQDTAYPLQTAYPTQQYVAQYPTAQLASPYPTTYPTSPQQPPGAYPTGQAPPAPYPSDGQAPSAPYLNTGEQNEKPELYPDAPPSYTDLTSYPTVPPNPGYPPAAEQQQPTPQYY